MKRKRYRKSYCYDWLSWSKDTAMHISHDIKCNSQNTTKSSKTKDEEEEEEKETMTIKN